MSHYHTQNEHIQVRRDRQAESVFRHRAGGADAARTAAYCCCCMSTSATMALEFVPPVEPCQREYGVVATPVWLADAAE